MEEKEPKILIVGHACESGCCFNVQIQHRDKEVLDGDQIKGALLVILEEIKKRELMSAPGPQGVQ